MDMASVVPLAEGTSMGEIGVDAGLPHVPDAPATQQDVSRSSDEFRDLTNDLTSIRSLVEQEEHPVQQSLVEQEQCAPTPQSPVEKQQFAPQPRDEITAGRIGSGALSFNGEVGGINHAVSFSATVGADGDASDMIVTIDCGGKVHRTYVKTLRRLPRTRLWRMVGTGGELLKNGFLFLDRHPKCFAAILNYYRTDRLVQPFGVSDELWFNELKYYQIRPPIEKPLSDEEIEERAQQKGKPSGPHFRLKLWMLLEDANSSRLAKIYALISMIIVLLATMVFIVESLPQFQDESEYARSSKDTFEVIESCCIVWFTAEFVLRLYATGKRWMFMTSILNLIDLVAILPWYLKLLPINSDNNNLTILRVIRLVKVFRIFRFGRYSTGLRLLLFTLQQSRGELSIMLMFLTMGVVLFGSALYFTESDAECLDPTACFESIPHSMWWAIITCTTVGYGDMTPTTGAGKFIASIAVVCGVIMLGLPISVLSSNFNEKYAEVKKLEEAVIEQERLRRGDVKLAAFRGKSALSHRLAETMRKNPNLSSLEGFEHLLKEVFAKYDRDGSGAMEACEVADALGVLGVTLDTDAAMQLMTDIDINQDGVLDYFEFRAFAAKATLEGGEIPEDMYKVLSLKVEQWDNLGAEREKERLFESTRSSGSFGNSKIFGSFGNGKMSSIFKPGAGGSVRPSFLSNFGIKSQPKATGAANVLADRVPPQAPPQPASGGSAASAGRTANSSTPQPSVVGFGGKVSPAPAARSQTPPRVPPSHTVRVQEKDQAGTVPALGLAEGGGAGASPGPGSELEGDMPRRPPSGE